MHTQQIANQNVSDIVHKAVQHTDAHQAFIVYDTDTPINTILAQAYKNAIPDATLIDFNQHTPDQILKKFEELIPNDLVVLIQSTSFRLSAFRIRVDLFKNSIKVVEHVHLSRMVGEYATRYIDSLAYDQDYYHTVGKGLKNLIDKTKSTKIHSLNGSELVFSSPLESAKLNIGDYTGMKNIGGMYPIGEVFTEAKKLEAVNGHAEIFIFGDSDFTINKPEHPITLEIKEGRVEKALNSTPEFEAVLNQIRSVENEVWIRELGFGLNRAFTQENTVPDIGSYERMCGVHLSLGKKHAVYNKTEYFRRKDTRFHIDAFIATDSVFLDEQCVYKDGAWIV